MARIGVVHVLKYWLESSKTYHGPINLRFTWPIDLTKTYHLWQKYREYRVINMLGKQRHGFVCWFQDCSGGSNFPDSLTINVYYHGRTILKYKQPMNEKSENTVSLRITEAYVAAPVMYVHKFRVDWCLGDNPKIVAMKLVRSKDVDIELVHSSGYGEKEKMDYLVAQNETMSISTPYHLLLQRATDLSD